MYTLTGLSLLLLMCGADAFRPMTRFSIGNSALSTKLSIPQYNSGKTCIYGSPEPLDGDEVITRYDINVESSGPADDIKRTLNWVAAASIFAGIIAVYKGVPAAIEYCSGYMLEQCLSVDNLFVFLVLFDYFGVPTKHQERVLQYGVWGAIVLRGIFISLGAVALQQFHQVLLLFAGVLLYSSYKILFGGDDDEEDDPSEQPIIKFASKFLRTTDTLDGDRFFTIEDGVRKATPLLLCLVCVELSDVVFAFDSVPAIFGVTEDPFIVFSSNIFAIAGLRSLYGVLSSAVADLKYLEKAVGVILGVIAGKMVFETFGVSILNPLQSLMLVIAILGGGVGLSLLELEKNPITQSETVTEEPAAPL